MNRLNNFFEDFELELLLEHCNDDDLIQNANTKDVSVKSGGWIKSMHNKCDTMLTEYGYDTTNSNCRLQTTMPGTAYKTHRDSEAKQVSLIIYLIGKDGTVFYEDAEKKNLDGVWRWYGSNPSVDTFTPNTGYWFDNHESQVWHSYKNTQDTPRWIFMYNVLSKKFLMMPQSNKDKFWDT